MAYKKSLPPSHRNTRLSHGDSAEQNITGASPILHTPVIPVMQVVQIGSWVEWLSPALPKQQGEVLAVYQDNTFEVFHPLAATLCRLPLQWVIKVLRDSIDSQGSAREREEDRYE